VGLQRRLSQTWHWGAEHGSTGYAPLYNSNNVCLGVSGGSTANGAHVTVSACLGTGHLDQYWKVGTTTCGEGEFDFNRIENEKSGKYLTVSGNSHTEGAQVVIEPNQGTCNSQFWY
jgi:hypothetical protein